MQWARWDGCVELHWVKGSKIKIQILDNYCAETQSASWIMIIRSRVRWFVRDECSNDADWLRCYMMMMTMMIEIKGTKLRGCLRRHSGIVLRWGIMKCLSLLWNLKDVHDRTSWESESRKNLRCSRYYIWLSMYCFLYFYVYDAFCHRVKRIWMNEWEPANQTGKWLLKWCVCVCVWFFSV